MHERGEALSPEEVYRQNLGLALSVLEYSRQTGSTAVYVQYDTPDLGVPSIMAREIVNAETNKAPLHLNQPDEDYVITYREWRPAASISEPTTQTVGSTVYRLGYQGCRVAMDDFSGVQVSPAAVLRPFFEARHCNSYQNHRDLIAAINASGSADDPNIKRYLTIFRNDLLKTYSPADIRHYLQVIDGFEVLPPPIARPSVSAEVTRRLVNMLAPRDRTTTITKPLSEPEIAERVRTLDEMNLLDGASLVSRFAYRNFAFSQALHNRLHSDRLTETLHYLKDPLDFAREYMGNILDIYTTQPERNQHNARLLLERTRGPRGHQLDFTKVIGVANQITEQLNKFRDKREQMLPFESVHDFRHVSGAFFRILGLTRTEQGESAGIAADRIHAEIVETLLRSVIKRELGRSVISLTDIAERYPNATQEELVAMQKDVERGMPYDRLSERYAKARGEHGSAVYWKRQVRGTGIIS